MKFQYCCSCASVADSLQSIEVEGNKQYWFVENVIVADVILEELMC
jgi:hypothetical protein